MWLLNLRGDCISCVVCSILPAPHGGWSWVAYPLTQNSTVPYHPSVSQARCWLKYCTPDITHIVSSFYLSKISSLWLKNSETQAQEKLKIIYGNRIPPHHATLQILTLGVSCYNYTLKKLHTQLYSTTQPKYYYPIWENGGGLGHPICYLFLGAESPQNSSISET